VAQTGTEQLAAGRPGRPRRYDEAEELERILDAGFEVIRRKGYRAATVADILAEAGMSTRSFYRHFAAKDDLLHALFRRDAEQFAAKVATRVEAAAEPAAALVVWIDEILGFGFERRRAQRAAVLGAPSAMSSLDPSELSHAMTLLMTPLVEVLTAGVADGTFGTCEPSTDAPMISALAWDGSARVREAATKPAKDDARARLVSFVQRAIGAPE
jgi:AcrR family transcriptional regulator